MTDPPATDLRRLVLQRLEGLQRAGVECLPRAAADSWKAIGTESAQMPATTTGLSSAPSDSAPSSSAPSNSAPSDLAPPDSAPSAPLTPSLFSVQPEARSPMTRQQRQEALDNIRTEVAACRRCEELACSRTQTVFGVGNPQPKLAFLGEAPGADEDRQGEPFVGRAGQLLNKIIEACTLRREDVYILNILKCRPPGNRNPSAEEAANCRDFLIRQLDVLQPEYICCLGAVAAQNLLDTTCPIGKLRGRFHDFRGIKVMATYHPAYLLRNPNAKRATWDDMKMLMTDMGIKIKSSGAAPSQ